MHDTTHRKWGRRVGSVVYWTLVIYLVSAGVFSIVAQLFFPPKGNNAAAECTAMARQLEQELNEVARNALTIDPSTGLNPNETFLAWDARLRAFGSTCSGTPELGQTLRAMRQRTATHLNNYRQDRKHGRFWLGRAGN